MSMRIINGKNVHGYKTNTFLHELKGNLMNKNYKVGAFIVVSSCFLAILIFVFYRSPPHYFNFVANYYMYESELNELAKNINNLENIKSAAIGLSGSIEIENYEGASKVDDEQSKPLENLIHKVSINPVWRHKKDLVFYAGSASKFNKNFLISYVYTNGSRNSVKECDKLYLTQNRGVCDFLLGENWLLNYTWLDL